MNTFFLDLTGLEGMVACVDETKMAASVAIDRKVRDAGLMEAATDCLNQSGWSWDDVTHVACVVGPGGFMSIRVAVAFANALAWGRKIPIAGLHGSDLVMARLDDKDFIWVHSTKREEVFARGFGQWASSWSEATHLSLQDVLAGIPKDAPFAGDVLSEHAVALEAVGHRRLELKPMTDVLPALLIKASFGTEQLVPWYGRQG